MKLLLYPLTFIYRLISWLDKIITKPVRIPKPVISIGNITWGGTGKTPVVIYLANQLIEMGLKPVILTRGYSRKVKARDMVVVRDEKKILADIPESGDEPYLIAKQVPGAIVIAGANRAGSAEFALKQFYNCDIFILDDGFQHWKIERDLDIVLINASDPFGNGMVIPAGSLRETLSSLKRADLIMTTSSDLVSEEKIHDIINKIQNKSQAPVLKTQFLYPDLTNVGDGKEAWIGNIKAHKIAVFSGLGDNNKFVRTLEKLGLKIEKSISFKDHHWYDVQDFTFLKHFDYAVTTQKDAEKIRKLNINLNKIYYLNMELSFMSGEDVWQKKIQKVLQFS